MTREKRVRRFDIASIFEKAFEHNEWKGDKESKGVFFTDEAGYCINKVLAIRAQHEEEAPKVFYSFFAPSIDEQVTLDFPYTEMKANPKKHHLLFKKSTIGESEVGSLFDIDSIGELVIYNEDVCPTIQEVVPNKRERDRTQIHLKPNEEGIKMNLVRSKKNQQTTLHSFVAPGIKGKFNNTQKYQATVNANTLHTVLRIFPEKTKVLFQFSHDRMKLTGNLLTEDKATSRVEVVLALMKD